MPQEKKSPARPDRFQTLADLIDALEQQGRKTAIHALRKQDARQISRAKLFEQIQSTAAALREAGVDKGDAVALWAENSPEWIIACLAVIRAGGRVVPLDVQLDRKAMERILENCEPRLMLTSQNLLERLKELSTEPPRTLLLDRNEENGESLWTLQGDADLPNLTEDDEATLFYTSGTTGPPKGVPLTHGNLIFQIKRILRTNLTREDDRVLLPLPLHHVYPFVIGMLLPLGAKIPIVLPLAMTGPQILRALKEAEVSVICGVPRLYRALHDAITQRISAKNELLGRTFTRLVHFNSATQLKTKWNPANVLFYPLHQQIGPQLRLLASGGSPLDPDLGRFLVGLGWQVAIGYGLTETSPLLTLNPPDSGRFDSVGKAIVGVELKLDLKQGEDENQGEVLAIGPNVFRGYYKMPEKNEKAFTEEGWFRTGDLGTIDEQGFLCLSGRASTLIVTESGKNINPEDVEEAYAKSSQIKEIGVLEEDGKLVALVVAEDTEQDAKEKIETALQQIADDLPSYWHLTDFALTSRSLPRTRLGKIRRHLLAEEYHAAQGGKTDEARKEPLPLEEMSGEDRALLANSAARSTWDWFSHRYADKGLTPDSRLQSDLGIDSLEWLTVTVEIGQRTGIELDEEVIAEVKSVRDLLQIIATEEQEGGASFSGEPLEKPEEVLSDQQRRWLRPAGPLLGHVQSMAFALNRLLTKAYFDVEISGLDNLPDGHCVLAPNHLSSLDPLVIAAALPQEVLKKTWWGGWTGIAFGNPLVRAISRLGNAVPIDPKRAVISSLAFGAAILNKERNLVWFPEGRRARDGKLQRFKPGIGLILTRYPAPVVPVLIDGTYELLPSGKLWPRRGRIRIVFGEPCDPQQWRDADKPPQDNAKGIANALQDEIAQMQQAHTDQN
ncbi:long-chain acyl-CoA synthetase [Geoalkalibacter ferrihydriticus]|uniref:Long-chain acyl-CoA synthetase n=1 Tax=Geoalkalibacter ferrihydriticus TaxID=392333 RepID=A0A1G9RHN1_9BACT|nr:AMP-binding protein [Geoalkalibacter ferrihydriticus]SDM22744.1 long-chain acyl-CoA synthetase [Geoalkalibacter ferrihydriticus]